MAGVAVVTTMESKIQTRGDIIATIPAYTDYLIETRIAVFVLYCVLWQDKTGPVCFSHTAI